MTQKLTEQKGETQIHNYSWGLQHSQKSIDLVERKPTRIYKD